jgi:hypothetical protein
MLALLTPRFWIGLAVVGLLAFTHAFVYRAGRAAVRADWDKEKAVQVADALIASEKRRNDEKALNITNQGITNAYLKEKSRLVAAERVTAGRLRDLQAAAGSDSRPDSAPLGGADDPRGTIISQCARALVGLDDYAQGVAAKARALQDYANQVRLTP